MDKKLSEMTLEELWQLFPIVLTEHDGRWTEYYAEEAAELAKILPKSIIINHIGVRQSKKFGQNRQWIF